MEKVVPFFKTFTTIFYFNFFNLGKILFGSVKVWNDLNWIWFRLNSNLNQIKLPPCGTVAGPPVSLPRLRFKRQRSADYRPPPPRARRVGAGPPSQTQPCAPLARPPCGAQHQTPPPPFSPHHRPPLKWAPLRPPFLLFALLNCEDANIVVIKVSPGAFNPTPCLLI
jgi:hypothetical protein